MIRLLGFAVIEQIPQQWASHIQQVADIFTVFVSILTEIFEASDQHHRCYGSICTEDPFHSNQVARIRIWTYAESSSHRH